MALGDGFVAGFGLGRTLFLCFYQGLSACQPSAMRCYAGYIFNSEASGRRRRGQMPRDRRVTVLLLAWKGRSEERGFYLWELLSI